MANPHRCGAVLAQRGAGGGSVCGNALALRQTGTDWRTAAEAVSGAVLRGAGRRILSAFRGGTFYLFHELPLHYADLCHRGSVSGTGIPAAPEREKVRVPLALRHRLDVVRLLCGMCGGVLHRAGVGQLGKF